MELLELLSHKPLYYKEFDPNRIKEAYRLLKPHIYHPKRIQLIGTNGKGSTGRAIAHLASKSGLKVGHYTSPHILDFKERFWINGKFASLQQLQEAHNKLYFILGCDVAQSLSYFEYLTLLAFVLFENLDLQVIEAGLGGEFDATSVVNYTLSVITPIGFDHSSFLGNSIKDIATTKLKAMSKKVLIAKQNYKEVYTIAKKIAQKNNSELFYCKECNYDIKKYSKKKGWPKYLEENITLALKALEILNIKYDLNNLETLELFGRFYRLMPNVIIDVGHNSLAANAISSALEGKVTLIFNILDDKDLSQTLQILKEKIERVEIIKIQTQRATDLKKIEQKLTELDIPFGYFNGKLDTNRDYLVFGSFYVVEEFLKSIGMQKII